MDEGNSKKRYTHEEQVEAFFIKGQSCIKSAKVLFGLQENSKNGFEYRSYEYEMLLVHGIELLLDSFVLLKDYSTFAKGMEKLRSYKHKYKELYNRCLELDENDIFNDKQLKSLIDFLSYYFYPDSITARFPKKDSIRYFSLKTFRVLDKKLIKPLDILRINYWENVDSEYRKKKEASHRRERKKWREAFYSKI